MPQAKKIDRRPAIMIVVGLLVIIGAVAGITVMYRAEKAKQAVVLQKATVLADCLATKGTTMYGAVWCQHCKNTKKLFGESFAKIHYVECADDKVPSGQSQACADAGIKSYPTWDFGGGVTATGELPLEEIALKSGCELPDTAAKVEAGGASPALLKDVTVETTADGATKATKTTGF